MFEFTFMLVVLEEMNKIALQREDKHVVNNIDEIQSKVNR